MRLAFWRTEKPVARPVLQPGADSPYVPRREVKLGFWEEFRFGYRLSSERAKAAARSSWHNSGKNGRDDMANVTVTTSSDEPPSVWQAHMEALAREIRRLKTDIKLYAMGAAGVGYIAGLIMGFIGGAIAS